MYTCVYVYTYIHRQLLNIHTHTYIHPSIHPLAHSVESRPRHKHSPEHPPMPRAGREGPPRRGGSKKASLSRTWLWARTQDVAHSNEQESNSITV